MHLPPTITRPLGLTVAASVAQITAAIETHNKMFDDVRRMLRSSSKGADNKKQATEDAKALFELRGVEQGTLINVNPMHSAFDGTLDAVFSIHVNQDHQHWDDVYPNAQRMPEDLVSAFNTLLNTSKSHSEVHLFSDTAEH